MDFSFLGTSAAVVIVVLLFLKFQTDQMNAQERRDRIFAEALERVASSSENVATATREGQNKVAKAITKQSEESEKRNGHLAELAIENKNITLEAINTIKNQHVITQTVDRQTIKEK